MSKYQFILILLALNVLIIPLVVAQQKNPQYYFDKGESAFDRGEYITAQAHLTECIRLDNHFAEAYRLRAMVREHLHEDQKALTDYNIYLDLIPQDREVLLSRALLRFNDHQYMTAKSDFLAILELPHGETRTVRFAQEKHNPASLEVFTDNSRSNDHIFNYLGLIEMNMKQYDRAVVWLDSAVKLQPKFTTYRINRGTAKLEKKDVKGALSDFEEVLKIDPDNSLAMHNIAAIKSAAGEDNSSEELLNAAIEKNPSMPYPWAARAFKRLQKNNIAGAIQDYDEAIRLQPNAEEHYINRGIAKDKLKNYKEAAKDFSKAIELNSKNIRAWINHGNTMSKLAKWQDAVDDYTVAITLDSKSATSYYNRSLAFLELKKLSSACADLKMSEKLGAPKDVKLEGRMCR